MEIFWTKHAQEKFEILEKQGFMIKRELVEKTLKLAELIDNSQFPLLVAQKSIDEKHILKVVFKKEGGIIKIITFYPMRKK
ncbi:MAG: hypothetical protein COT33_01630 [Candidatus Nealsonbacteria bacterium CG08_land_8_20_14_0_20_38_20]|uniref:DUF4258 domain-containing protein n=1 Tax=Candidatus Nealsonbacteria bacterium CG08_land_8_20_14_0_20_38_20 TaxID=1974705 RepID=A0A2H0YLY5_9BACT|nr:MAG: hypothetical protein COT33_01630 [Candidatus Nealsonbacteria bacterium CG08_land_8_20_14_0_20_38_20]